MERPDNVLFRVLSLHVLHELKEKSDVDYNV